MRYFLLLIAVTSPLAAAPGDVHLLLGNPSNAKADRDNPDPTNFLMVKDQFALSYNSKKGIPNWVSYRLQRRDTGRARRGDFFPDNELPRQFFRVAPFDYRFSQTGWTRGHMCPSGHRNNTDENSQATFVMTNMVPQTEELNAGAWNKLERYCRDLLYEENKELYIVCGPHGKGGKTNHGYFESLAEGRITVPRSCWNVVLVLDAAGGNPIGKVKNKSTRLIGVVMPNDRTPENKPWDDYLVSVADIEQLTGLTFFDKAPAEAIGPLKKKVDRGQ